MFDCDLSVTNRTHSNYHRNNIVVTCCTWDFDCLICYCIYNVSVVVKLSFIRI
nr:MAG TPA: hypothetical protein [Caudoviricetes sp.]